jgi:hypothetical protein
MDFPIFMSNQQDVSLTVPLNGGGVLEFMIPAGKGYSYLFKGHEYLIEAEALFAYGNSLQLLLLPNNTLPNKIKSTVSTVFPFLYAVLEGMGDITATFANLAAATADARSGAAQASEIQKAIEDGAYYDIYSGDKLFSNALKVELSKF